MTWDINIILTVIDGDVALTGVFCGIFQIKTFEFFLDYPWNLLEETLSPPALLPTAILLGHNDWDTSQTGQPVGLQWEDQVFLFFFWFSFSDIFSNESWWKKPLDFLSNLESKVSGKKKIDILTWTSHTISVTPSIWSFQWWMWSSDFVSGVRWSNYEQFFKCLTFENWGLTFFRARN